MENERDFNNVLKDEKEGFYLPQYHSLMNESDFTTENDNMETTASTTNIQTLELLRDFLDCYISGVKGNESQCSHSDTPTKYKSEKAFHGGNGPPKPPRTSAGYGSERTHGNQLPVININLFFPDEYSHCNKCRDLLHDIGTVRTNHEPSPQKDNAKQTKTNKKHADEMQHFEKKSFNSPNNLLKSILGERTHLNIPDSGNFVKNPVYGIQQKGKNVSENVEYSVLTARGSEKNFSSHLRTNDTVATSTRRSKESDYTAYGNENDSFDETQTRNSSAISNAGVSDSLLAEDKAELYSETRSIRRDRALSDPNIPKTENTETSFSLKHTFSQSFNAKLHSEDEVFSLPNYHSLNYQSPISSSINWQYPGERIQGSDHCRIPTPLHDDLDIDQKEIISSILPEPTTTSDETSSCRGSVPHSNDTFRSTPQNDTVISTKDWFEHKTDEPWTPSDPSESSGNDSVSHNSSEGDSLSKSSISQPNRYAPYNKVGKAWTQTYSYETHSYTIYSFAKDNGFEVHDVSADGNCMFRAIHDQLRINGIFHPTPKSIRVDAVRYLREHPNQEDGDHLKSFLGGEKSWEDYLDRMSRVGEWGDHMMLKAIVDMLGRRLIVINVKPYDEIRQTDLDPYDKTSSGYKEKPLYLGHISEAHYLSLRPVGWELEWPKAALMERLKERVRELSQLNQVVEEVQTLCSDQADPNGGNKRLDEKTRNDEKSKQDPEKRDMATAHYSDCPSVPPCEISSSGNHLGATPDDANQITSSLRHKQESMTEQFSNELFCIQTEDMDMWMKTDRAYIDSVSKLPMPHLSFLLENVLDMAYFLHSSVQDKVTSKMISEYIGSASDGSCRVLQNYSDCPEMTLFIQNLMKVPIPIKFFKNNVKFPSCGNLEREDVCVVTEHIRPGYCRLRPANPSLGCWSNTLHETPDGIYFIKKPKCTNKTWRIWSVPLNKTTDVYIKEGFRCLEWPTTAAEWLTRERPSKWPTKIHVQSIKENGCCLLNCSDSSESGTESQLDWRFIFFHAEKYLFEKCLSSAQLHGYCIFKALVDYQLRLCDHKLKTVHIKSLFFFACEEISETMWQDSLGSCVMFMMSKLLFGLRSRFIPNYFIQENNMIDHYDAGALKMMMSRLEPIRLFPVETLMFMAERYGLEAFRTRNQVIRDVTVYLEDNDLKRSIIQTFIPAKLEFARRLIDFYKYERAYKCICRAYEMHVTCPPSPNGTPPFVPERLTFFRNFIHSIYDSAVKVMFTFYLVSTSSEFEPITDKGKGEDIKYIKDIIGGETLMGMENVPVPVGCANNLSQEAYLLESFAVYFFTNLHYRESEVCLTWAIKHMKRVMKEEYIDVSEITDSDLKSTIGLQNVENFKKWNKQLCHCYKKLKTLYSDMNNLELIRCHMEDIEELHERAPELGMTYFIEDLWNKLQDPKRAKAVRARSAMPQLDPSYESMNDVD